MKLHTCLAAALFISGTCVLPANAQLYWDTNVDGGLGGSGTATPAGAWDVGINSNWNTDGGGFGAPGFWTNGSDAVFSAGTDATGAYAVTLGGTVSANSISFEEGNATISGGTELDLTGTANISVTSPATGSISSIVGGSTVINKIGGGTLDVSGANTFTGGFNLSAGTVRAGSNTALGAASSAVTIGSGTTLSATSSTARTLTYNYIANGDFTLGQTTGGTGTLTLAGTTNTFDLGGATRTITVNNGSNTISAIVSNGGITKEGTGTLTLSGANTYTGPVTVNAGILSSTATSGLGTSAGGVTVNNAATLQVSGSNTQVDAISLSGTGSTGTNGAVRKTGANTTTLSGTLTGSGSIVATAGTLKLSNTSGSGFTGAITVTGTVATPTTLSYSNQTALGTAAGSGVITLDGGKLLNTLTGNAGTFSPATRNIVLGANGGILEWAGDTVATDLIILQTGTVISGTAGGTLTKSGAGILSVVTPATYDGPTHVAAGTLRVRTNNNVYPTGTALAVDSGAIFDLNGLGQAVGSVEGAGNVNLGSGTFTNGSSNASTVFSGQIVETGGGTGGKVTKQGTGTLTLSGNSLYTGLTTISAGAIAAQSNTALGTTAGSTTVSSGAQLQIDGTGLNIAEPLTISGTGLATNGAVRNLANDNTISGAVALGAATRIQSDGGTLTVSGGILSSSTTTRNLTVGGAGNVTISGVVGDPAATNNIGTLTKSDAGTLTLTAASGNVYTGATTVSGGKLLVNNTTGSATGVGAVTVASGATLGGTGIIGGAITNNGILSPGIGGVGTLSTTGNFLNGANSVWNIDLSGATADMLAVTGNIDLTAVDTLNVLGSGTGSSWIIGSYTGIEAGAFDTITPGYSVTYSGGNITLNVAAACAPGDLNCDGHTDARDYVFWRKNNSTPAGDYSTWRTNFGTPPGSGSGSGLGGTAVPEPTSLGLIVIGFIALGFGRRAR